MIGKTLTQKYSQSFVISTGLTFENDFKNGFCSGLHSSVFYGHMNPLKKENWYYYLSIQRALHTSIGRSDLGRRDMARVPCMGDDILYAIEDLL